MAKQIPIKAIIVDQSLKNQIGHHLEYSVAVRDALKSAGLDAKIYAHADCEKTLADAELLNCHFRETWTEKSIKATILSMLWGISRLLGANSQALKCTGSFAATLDELIKKESLTGDDHVIVHTLNFVQLLQTLQVFGKGHSPHVHIVLRQDPGESSRGGLKNALLKLVFAVAKKTPKANFYSDTPALTQEFQRISGIEFRTLPILFKQHPFMQKPRNRASKFAVTYLGDGRLEKGYQFLPNIIVETISKTNNVVFKIQSYVASHSSSIPEIVASQNQLRELATKYPENLVLTEMPLDQASYAALLLESDAVLIPYDPVAYRYRSSGVLAQGAVAAKYLIYPSGTSLSEQAVEGLSYEYNTILDIPAIIAKLVSIDQTAEHKEKAAQKFRAAHSPEAFVKALKI